MQITTTPEEATDLLTVASLAMQGIATMLQRANPPIAEAYANVRIVDTFVSSLDLSFNPALQQRVAGRIEALNEMARVAMKYVPQDAQEKP